MADGHYDMVFLVPESDLIDPRCKAEIVGPVCKHAVERSRGSWWLGPRRPGVPRPWWLPCRDCEREAHAAWIEDVAWKLRSALRLAGEGRPFDWDCPNSCDAPGRD